MGRSAWRLGLLVSLLACSSGPRAETGGIAGSIGSGGGGAPSGGGGGAVGGTAGTMAGGAAGGVVESPTGGTGSGGIAGGGAMGGSGADSWGIAGAGGAGGGGGAHADGGSGHGSGGTAGAGGAGGEGSQSPCQLAVTGSCLMAGYQCVDYTATDATAQQADCPTTASQSWSARPCAAGEFRDGCLFGTPGTDDCSVTWRAGPTGNFLATCDGLLQGTIVHRAP